MNAERCPVLRGQGGAVSAAHPAAVAAGRELLLAGGSAADAAIAAQAVLCVVMPDACGLGGDMLALIHTPGNPLQAINGTGCAPRILREAADDGPNSITVPGIVDAWCRLSSLHGRVPLSCALAPAIRLAREGLPVGTGLAATLTRHRARLARGGAASWCLFDAIAGRPIVQAELGSLLERIGNDGRKAFYEGANAAHIAAAIGRLGGTLSVDDLAAHATPLAAPIETRWDPFVLAAQPPMAQGILLNMAVQALSRSRKHSGAAADHIAIELTNAAFAYRDEVANGRELLAYELSSDPERASNRGGPRAYLHTAGVACADAQGMVVSSLVSVFDDFGSAVYVPEIGITLNNRAGGFTAGANAAAAGKRPVHTLAPAMLRLPQGILALATPGADGQVQTLLQVLMALHADPSDLATAIAAAIAKPRWRSENGGLLIEQGHPHRDALSALGHRITPCADGDLRLGAVVCAGVIEGRALAAADWRRETDAGIV
jgi:gamma-glutamyltranspeptidase/glutathione hydrolase